MNFADIKKLVKIVSSLAPPQFKNFFTEPRPNTKLQELLDGVADSSITSDEEAAQRIYSSHAGDKRYLILRRDLFDDLGGSLLFYDLSKSISAPAWRRIQLSRRMLTVQVLLALGVRATATRLAERVNQEARVLNLTSVEIQSLVVLRESAALHGDHAHFEKYNQEIEAALKVQSIELKAEQECQRIEISFAKSVIGPDQIYSNAMGFVQYLDDLPPELLSFSIRLNRFRILHYALQINHQFAEAIDVCNEAVEFLEQWHEAQSKMRLAEFKVNAMEAAMRIRRYDEALQYGLECIGYGKKGNRNWYTYLDRMMLIYFHQRKFENALEMYLEASTNSGFNDLPQYEKERWLMYRGFLGLFVNAGIIESRINRSAKREFSITAITQEINAIVQDKKGLNVTVMILHILYAIQEKDNELTTTRMYLFQEYAKRFLSTKEHSRTIKFLDLLKVLRKAKYDKAKANIQGQHIFALLKNDAESPATCLESGEVVPYETLWEWILDVTAE